MHRTHKVGTNRRHRLAVAEWLSIMCLPPDNELVFDALCVNKLLAPFRAATV